MMRLSMFAAICGGLLLCAACSSPTPGPSSTITPAPPPTPAPSPAPLPTRDPVLFNQTFWNEFVHNGFDAPPGTEPLRRLTAAPMIYLKTIDEAGLPIDAPTLQTVEDALRFIAPTWSGGQFGLAGVTRGTGTMEGQRGWLTVKWPNPPLPNLCGRVSGVGGGVGVDGGAIELNYLAGGTCSCNGSKVRPHTAYHELGHAFGYWHTDRPDDLMFTGGPGCDARPSAREIYHAQLAYQSPIGTTTARPRAPLTIID